MRRLFGELLVASMKDPRIFLLCGDVGYGILDECFASWPARCYNMGAAEQAMVGAAVGLSYEGKLPICYTITPFLLYRPYEWLRNYVEWEEEPANIRLVGSGRKAEYKKEGYTHWSYDQEDVLDTLQALRTFFPDTKKQLEKEWKDFLHGGAAYLSLSRA